MNKVNITLYIESTNTAHTRAEEKGRRRGKKKEEELKVRVCTPAVSLPKVELLWQINPPPVDISPSVAKVFRSI